MIMHKSSFQESDIMTKEFYKIIFIMSILLITLPLSRAEETVSQGMTDWTHAERIDEQSITWIGYNNYTMNWGDRISITDWALGNFTIELTDLMKDATGNKIIGALLTVTDGNKKSQVALGNGESQIVPFAAPFDDEMKISANINGERTWSKEFLQANVSVQVFLRNKPDINLSSNIYTENPESNGDANTTDNINSNQLFYTFISIHNNGNATLKEVKLEVNLTNFTVPQEQLIVQKQGMSFKYTGNSMIYDLNDLKVNDVLNPILEVVPPKTLVNTTFYIPMMLTGKDDKNVAYTFRSGVQFIVKPFIEITKQVGPYVNYSGTDVLYVGESFFVSLDIRNHGNQNVTINLTDSVPDSFEYQTKENKSLDWFITIPAGSSRTITYSIKPIRYKETVIIPKATGVFEFGGKEYRMDSNDIEVMIKGADVFLTKDVKIDKLSDGIINASIMITARNLGDQRVALIINDTLPDNSNLINGTISMDNIFLNKGELYSYGYEISVPLRERIILPPAKGYFSDLRTYLEKDSGKKEDFLQVIGSNQPIIEIRPPAPVTTPENISKNKENITIPNPAKEEVINTKLGIIKNVIREFIKFIMGEKKAPETVQQVSLPEAKNSIKRIEETHSSFTYSVGWESQSNVNASGGTWRVSRTAGSRVAVSFAGTGVGLFYASNPEGGIANIDIDGKGYPDIDMYSPIPGSVINKTIASGLKNSRHTLTITVSSTRNQSSSNSMVVVDAVEIAQPDAV